MKPLPKKEFFSKRLNLILSRLERNRFRVLKGRDPEALHDFRVSLRRLRTCLRLLKGCYLPRTLVAVFGFLKGIGQETNVLRDKEVFDSLLKSLPPIPSPSPGLQAWLKIQEEVRQMREKEIRNHLVSPPFVRGFSRLGKKLVLRANRQKITSEAMEAFEHEKRRLENLLKKTKTAKTSRSLLHKLRVQAKRMRYSLEEFGFLLSRGGRELATLCKKAQTVLGDWRDLDNALALLGKAGNGLFPETQSWIRELKNRRRKTWKEYQKAVRDLQEMLRKSRSEGPNRTVQAVFYDRAVAGR